MSKKRNSSMPSFPPHEITLRFLAEPTDVNFGGKVHGGAVMKWIDQAAYACAAGWSASYCVTVYVGGIRFYKPVLIGQVVEVRARLIYTGTTSMHIAVDVYSRDPKASALAQTTHCIIVFVAVDEAGNKLPVPHWEPKTEQERQMQAYALRLVELRKAIEDEMKPFLAG